MAEQRVRDERLWAMICHLAAFAGLLLPYAGFVVGPLIVWAIKKDEFPLVNDQGKESINFQISMLIYGAVAAALLFVGIGFLLVPAWAVAEIVLVIIAALAANNGEQYRYPLTLRLVK